MMGGENVRGEGQEKAMDINDPRVPELIRAHGRRFRRPSAVVVCLGNGEYILGTADGELLDLVRLQ